MGSFARIAGELRFAAAEQLMHRHFRDFAGDVPQGNVYAGQAENDRPAAAENMQLLLDFLRQRFDVQRIASDAHRREYLIDRDLCGGNDVIAEGFAPSGDAGVGADLHQQHVRRLPCLSSPDLRIRRAAAGVRNAQHDGLDFLDFHCFSPGFGQKSE